MGGKEPFGVCGQVSQGLGNGQTRVQGNVLSVEETDIGRTNAQGGPGGGGQGIGNQHAVPSPLGATVGNDGRVEENGANRVNASNYRGGFAAGNKEACRGNHSNTKKVKIKEVTHPAHGEGAC